jgi:hypothetical protein
MGDLYTILVETQHRLKEEFGQPLVWAGQKIPWGTTLLVSSGAKDKLVTLNILGEGHTVPLGEIRNLPGGVTVQFSDFLSGDDILMISPLGRMR